VKKQRKCKVIYSKKQKKVLFVRANAKNRAGFCAPLSAAFFAFVRKHPIVHLKETVRDRVNPYLKYLEKAFSPLFIVGRAGKCAVREGA